MRISFGPFAFDPQSRLLWREGSEIALPPRVLGVLEVLIERAGQVVARQDLLDKVWKDAFVTDTSLAEAVSFLRQALGDDPQAPRYIQTVHRRGYRFLPTPQPERDQGQTGGEAASASTAGPVAAAVDWQLIPWSIAALCAGLAAAAVWHDASRRAPEPPPVARLELRATPGTAFDRASAPIALSPDGRAIAWSACEIASGRCAIYLRAIDRVDAHPLAGTDEGHSPTFSPDGRWIAFFADGALKKIAAAGGAPTTIAPAPDPGGAAWGADGRIAYAPSTASGLAIVDAEGGAPQPLTGPDGDRGELRHRFPAWIPSAGGRGLVFTADVDPDPAAAGTLAALGGDGAGVRALRNGIHRAAPAGRGYLLLATATDLQAATFDDRALMLTGATDSVPAPAGDGLAEFVEFAAAGDALAIVRRAARGQWMWSDGADASALARFTSIAIAPDSQRAAGIDAGGDIWIVDLASSAATRLTFGGGHASPVWAADGSRLFFSSRTAAGPFHVVSRTVSDRNETPAPLPGAPPQAFPSSAAADGRVALTIYKDGHTRVAIATTDGGAPRVLTDGPFDERAAAFSPDGRWLALESTASGRKEIVVRSSADGRRIAVSQDGGTKPAWSRDGRAIYFHRGWRVLEAAFAADAPPARAVAVLDRAGERAIAVAPSGRVLIERGNDPDSALVALQWLRELAERLPLPVNAPR